MIDKNILNKRLIIFDTETEGLNGCFTRPWEIFWSVFEKGEEVESHECLLKWPDLKVSEGAARVTGFDPQRIEDFGQEPKEIIDLFDSFLYDDRNILVGANILGYDVKIINTARRQFGYKPDYSFIKRIYDVNAIARGLKWPVRYNPGDDFIAWQYKCLNIKMKGMKTKVQYLCEEYGIPFDLEQLHQAKYDSFLTEKVFRELVKRVNI